ncbi:Neural-cadherin [Chionoecetes opilio]|uniref:Neural-cadherin n=1 Tax=Chionoecetes opilio TaxID=41210 RepID=A0A8J4XRV5_CHIOP|nr:Neural-cadherin [Chionoecetes opilio]
MDGQEGVLIGGSPAYVGATMFKVHNDFREGCIDDLRISGRSAPLPPAVNNTPWGQASVFKGVERGCVAPSACTNVSCRPPHSCVDTWRSHHCGCGEGRVLSRSRMTCEDEDECDWQPCLSGSSCFNTQPGDGLGPYHEAPLLKWHEKLAPNNIILCECNFNFLSV